MPRPDLVLVTATRMPKPDPESGLLVRALAEAGLRAEIHPWDADLDWARCALVVCRTPWDYFTRVEEFLAWARHVAAHTTLLNPIETIAWNAHKSYLLDLERAGVPIVETILVARSAGLAEQDDALARFAEAVIKPAVSGGARGALRTTSGDPGAVAHLRALIETQDALVQPFVASVQGQGEASLIYFDGVFSHAVRKRPAAGDFRVHELYGGSVDRHVPADGQLEVAAAALAAAPTATAYARIDLVEGPDGPAVMEAELIEPELFLGADPAAPGRMAACLAARHRALSADSYA
jgi:glutathione synthase/RimK-type ligase-like ATP-grasp enzyme